MREIKYLSLRDFVQLGFLQEANRQFFHPHGLALEVRTDDTGAVVALGGIWDSRDDPKGIVFGDVPDRDKRDRVADEYERHREARLRLMGDVRQPLDWEPNR
jgi:hypothetical protein